MRYAVTYKPSIESGDKAFAQERAMQIAKEWSDGMNATNNGEIRDFVAVGDIDIKVIGAENQVIDTNVPVITSYSIHYTKLYDYMALKLVSHLLQGRSL